WPLRDLITLGVIARVVRSGNQKSAPRLQIASPIPRRGDLQSGLPCTLRIAVTFAPTMVSGLFCRCLVADRLSACQETESDATDCEDGEEAREADRADHLETGRHEHGIGKGALRSRACRRGDARLSLALANNITDRSDQRDDEEDRGPRQAGRH